MAVRPLKKSPTPSSPAPNPSKPTRIADVADIDLDRIGTSDVAGMQVEVIDPVADYATLMEELFDFGAIRDLIAGGFKVVVDSMSAVTGPYAVEIIEKRLGARQARSATPYRCPTSAAITGPEPRSRQGTL